MAPDLQLEVGMAVAHGVVRVAGLDEAGRGALAGPVFAAAVILPPDRPDIAYLLREVDDSKKLSAIARSRLFPLICREALAWGVGRASAADIDRLGIVPATMKAMRLALARCAPAAEALLVDGRRPLKEIPLPQQAVIRGDGLSLSIAAASILAKVSRDRHMEELDSAYPAYGFARHKGYGTAQHLAALRRLGPCREHRRSFAPLRA